uniref:Protein kinase domain-containing protein n=1 Tax=Peronospora matthiolae TaxID=2874970 RepID=A0AAV1UTC3_9STRA
MTVVSVGFIGSGRLAERVARSLIKHVAPQRKFCYNKQRLVSTLLASDPSEERRRVFTRLGFTTTDANRDVLADCDLIFLGTDARKALAAQATNAHTLYVSLMGDLPALEVEGLLCPGAKVIRLMPQSDLEKQGVPKGVLPPRSWATVRGSHVSGRDLQQVMRLAGIDNCIEVDENSTSWCFSHLPPSEGQKGGRIYDFVSSMGDHAVALSKRAVHTLGGKRAHIKNYDGALSMVEASGADFHDTYELGRELVSGKFSSVSEVTHRETGQQFAVKVIPDNELTVEGREMLIAEVGALNRLKHRHVIAHHGFYNEDGKFLLVLELCNYGSVRNLINEHKVVPEQVAKRILKQTLTALDYCHSMGQVHRDVKAENVLLCTNEDGLLTVKLADFGLSEELGLGNRRLLTMCGTPQYLSPEIVSGRRYGTPADIWSTGILAYMMLSGLVPFHEARNETELFKLISLGAVWYDQREWDAVSPAAKDFVQSMLEVSVESRLTAAELLQHDWLTDV